MDEQTVFNANGESALFEPRHVLDRTRYFDGVTLSIIFFLGFQRGGRLCFLNNVLSDFLALVDHFLSSLLAGSRRREYQL